MQNHYNKLTINAQYAVCNDFLTIYPNVDIGNIHLCFEELNPIVEWDEYDETKPYSIWEVWKPRFEKLLVEKTKTT